MVGIFVDEEDFMTASFIHLEVENLETSQEVPITIFCSLRANMTGIFVSKFLCMRT